MTFRAPAVTFALLGSALSLAVLCLGAPSAAAQQTVLPLWPHALPEPAPNSDPETNVSQRISNVTKPTLSLYPPKGRNTGGAALVFPGGAYARLAWDIEGTQTCDWVTSVGMTCLLVKYRVPQPPGDAGHYPADPSDLEDAQQAMRLTRAHASEWHINPAHIGVVGFSAGGNLAVLMSTHPDDHHVESTPAAADVNASIDAKPNFALVVYPAYLFLGPDENTLDPIYTPNAFTPDTFIIQAENDKTYGHNGLVYYRALMDHHVPAQLHYYASGGHGFGTFPVNKPEQNWTELANLWLRAIGILPAVSAQQRDAGPSSNEASPSPCTTPNPAQQPPLPGKPATQLPTGDPNCPPQP